MQVFQLEEFLSEVPDSATVKLRYKGQVLQVKGVAIHEPENDDDQYEISLILGDSK